MKRTRRSSARLPAWLAVLACACALVGALVVPPAAAEPAAVASADAGPDASTSDGSAAPRSDAGASTTASFTHGLHALPDDTEVPLKWMPPGSNVSPVPSEEIFPPQTIPLRFNHKKHVGDFKLSCKVCHAPAYDSDSSLDHLLPDPKKTCDNCHDVNHAVQGGPVAGRAPDGQCAFCHLGEHAGDEKRVAQVVVPRANLVFTHKKHLARNIDCAQCHGQVGELELATREQLPRMAGCFTCHAMSGAAQGDAKGQCTNCHVTRPDGKLVQTFATGPLVPPPWLHQAAHNADWIERHKTIAADDSAFCGSCHATSYCTDCHDGKVRPRKVHPNDWLSMHPQAARQDNPRCSSCHEEQTFCADCHRRTGVARDSASGNRMSGRRFHPPPAEWTTAPRGPNHHAWEAMRNLNACVSCHTERDCATCHATKGLSGGQGVNPHPSGFRSRCKLAFDRNPRPCLVCHQSNDAFVKACQ